MSGAIHATKAMAPFATPVDNTMQEFSNAEAIYQSLDGLSNTDFSDTNVAISPTYAYLTTNGIRARLELNSPLKMSLDKLEINIEYEDEDMEKEMNKIISDKIVETKIATENFTLLEALEIKGI